MGRMRTAGESQSHGRQGQGRHVTVGLALLVMASVLGPATAAGAGASVTPASAAAQTVGSGTRQATISRDSYGVPSITSSTMSGVWFGAGYAQAQDRMAQLELTRRTVEGTLA